MKDEFDLNVSSEDLRASVRRAFLRGMALELRQGYTKAEFCLPAEVFENPNGNIKLPNITSREFIEALEERVWAVFEPELSGILD